MARGDDLLDKKYTAMSGRVFMSGIQALARLPIAQMRRDRESGLDTGAFISGYRGSPLGGLDQQFIKAESYYKQYDILFQPGVNEDLAATAVWGSQQLQLSPGRRKDGVVGMWYGKGPGVDRCGDVFKHGNAAGASKHGGVLCIAGDDHTCKSSSIPHQSDHAFMSALMPVLYPSSIHEFLEMGLLGVAMSRYSGCWVGFKVIADTVETSAAVDLSGEQRTFVLPDDFELPKTGLNFRWPDPPLIQDERLQEYKGYAAIAFARANRLDETTLDTPNARLGIIGSGKAYEDVLQALTELGIGTDEAAEIGLRLYKVRMTWPLEPVGVRQFSQGLQEVLIVEERREIIENQIKQQLFNWRADVRPRIVGKFDHHDQPFLSLSKGLTVGAVARAIANRVLQFDFDEGLRAQIEEKLAYLQEREKIGLHHTPPILRQPHFCSGCPHNISTKIPDGSRALAGIGCHFMVQWMDRNTETFSQMGGEGVAWTATGRFTDEQHVFANLGDGTYFHSGLLAVRQAVAAKANITYKILYNDAVAMTGGQQIDGELSPEKITQQLHYEGVAPIYVLSDTPEAYSPNAMAPGTVVMHRDQLDTVMRRLRETAGCSAIVYEQTCAAEKRRRRKRGLLEDPLNRVMIHPTLCEGCGDCSVQSNCISIEPLETSLGRKRQINQSSCNKDYSCVKGFCPSFVTITGAELKKPAAAAAPDIAHLPVPAQPALNQSWNIVVTGVGGTGVLTVGAIVAMAAYLEQKNPMLLDMAGLAQKGGAVLSHIRIGHPDNPVTAPRIVTGTADLLLAADNIVAASKDAITLCAPRRTPAIVNTKLAPTSRFVKERDVDFRSAAVENTIRNAVKANPDFVDFSMIARKVCGDEIFSNILMLGFAWQRGFIPISDAAIEEAIQLNGVAIQANIAAFRWGRLIAHDPHSLNEASVGFGLNSSGSSQTHDDLVDDWSHHLEAYQDTRLAEKYRRKLSEIEWAADAKGLADGPKEALMAAVAKNYGKLLSYKDEYEVARLLSDPDFEAEIKAKFTLGAKISFNLAPPFLPGKTPEGRPKKRRFGPWLRPVLRLLAKFRHLRGGPWDMFGYTSERRAERALIADYEADMALAIDRLAAATTAETIDQTIAHAIALLCWPDQVRGFGPVKLQAMSDAKQQRARLRTAFETAATNPDLVAAA
jgi:indolepyruvate ferredoxin oxidoreductase